MSEPWKDLEDAVLATLRESVKDFLDDVYIDDFLKAKSIEFAREKYMAESSSDPVIRQEHLDNLKHLKAQVAGEAATLQIAMSTAAHHTFVKILETAAGLLVKVAPSILGAL